MLIGLATGKRILELQCSLGLISVADTSQPQKLEHRDPHGRDPFRHPAIESVECLLGSSHHWFTNHRQLATLAEQYGLPDVVRWHPRDVRTIHRSGLHDRRVLTEQQTERLEASGSELVYSQAIFAIIGAVALEQGTAVANQIAMEKVLVPLGLKRRWKSEPQLSKPSSP